MKTFFPENNLPLQSQDWVYKLEREISALKKAVAASASTSANQVAQVVQEIRSVKAETVSLKETAATTNNVVVPMQSFDFNIDGGRPGARYHALSVLDCGYFDSVHGGMEPIDGGRI